MERPAQMSGSCIWIVDDNKAHRRVIRRALLKAGLEHRCVEAASMAEARAVLLASEPPTLPLALIIIDLNLSDGRGTNLVEQLRLSDRLRDTPILMLSTSGLETDRDAAIAAGADAFLTKASDLEQLSSELAETCVRVMRSRP